MTWQLSVHNSRFLCDQHGLVSKSPAEIAGLSLFAVIQERPVVKKTEQLVFVEQIGGIARSAIIDFCFGKGLVKDEAVLPQRPFNVRHEAAIQKAADHNNIERGRRGRAAQDIAALAGDVERVLSGRMGERGERRG